MIDRVDYSQCCQCGNCSLICPTKAIDFLLEKNGFLYPRIDNNLCCKCNKCEKVCPAINIHEKTPPLQSFAAKNTDTDIVIKSSSGGIFSAIAEYIIEQQGVVYGAAFSDDLSVKHFRIENKEALTKIRGSKYVRSDLNNCFEKVVDDLRNRKYVLFSGTPCQCAALKLFVKDKEYFKNLYTVDFICHGILSERLFSEYIDYLEKKRKSKIKSFSFRNKKNGWIESGMRIVFQNGKVLEHPYYENIYMQGLFQGICMRENCYTCQYKDFHSGSDITLGDFWGAEVTIPDFYDKNGVSCVLSNSQKGGKLLSSISLKISVQSVSIEEIIKYNQGLIRPFSKGTKYNEYIKLSEKTDYFYALKKIAKLTFKEKCKKKLCLLRKKLKNIIRK